MDLTNGYRSGLIGEMIGLQMAYFGEEWGFGAAYESMLARDLGSFFDRFDAERDLVVCARDPGGRLKGTIVLDARRPVRGHLRWLLVAKDCQRHGIGSLLMSEACRFADKRSLPVTYLNSFAGLEAAASLFEAWGFIKVSSSSASGPRSEEIWERGRSLMPNKLLVQAG